MTENYETIVRIGAAVDALFSPFRDVANIALNAAIHQQRRAFPTSGISWQSPGADRKRAELDRRNLERGGLVKLYRPRGDRVAGIALTDKGDALMRALVALPCLAESVRMMREIQRHETDGRGYSFLGSQWVNEQWLAGRAYGSPGITELANVQLTLAPALCRGWVISNATAQRHVSYRLADKGIFDADPDSLLPPVVEPDEHLAECYFDELQSRKNALKANTTDSAADIGEIPLPSAAAATAVFVDAY